MPKKRQHEAIQHAYFRWVLVLRGGVWYADGRSNTPNAERHSLETADRQEALRQLSELDRNQAERLGLAPRSKRSIVTPTYLPLDEGRLLYLQHVNRSEILGGVRRSTSALYTSNLDSVLKFLKQNHVQFWNQVDARILEKLADQMEQESYAPKTIAERVKLVKQVVKWLIQEEHLTGCEPIRLKLRRFESERPHCWCPEEVEAMLNLCEADPNLGELYDVIVCLACTGLRISELASLRCSDIDLERDVLQLTDETGHKSESRRQLKNGRSRSLPLHPDLRAVLARRPRTGTYVFEATRGGKLHITRLRLQFKEHVVLKLADRFPAATGEQGFKDGRFHSFRHYFCSQCANANIPERMVMEWLGHADSEMVRHYYHLHDEEARRRMNQLNLLGRSVGCSGSAEEDVSPKEMPLPQPE